MAKKNNVVEWAKDELSNPEKQKANLKLARACAVFLGKLLQC